jgi:hypothetical protein
MTSLSWKLLGLVSGLMLMPAVWAQSGVPAPAVTVGQQAPAVNTDVPPSPAMSTDLPPAPAVSTEVPPAPVMRTELPPPAAARTDAPAADGAGTTIIGDHESPIGLYLTPWKNEYAERGMDRPARIVQETLGPIDQAVFHRQVDYYDTIAVHRKAELAAAKR